MRKKVENGAGRPMLLLLLSGFLCMELAVSMMTGLVLCRGV